MTFKQAMTLIGDRPLFEADDLPDTSTRPVQLSRWVASGRLYRLRRGLYALKPPYQRTVPHPFQIANRIVDGSYISLHSALSFHGLLADRDPEVTSVSTSRPGTWKTELGTFVYRHIKTDLFHDYEEIDMGAGQIARIANVEKALIDLFYLTPNADHPAFLSSLPLINLQKLNPQKIVRLANSVERMRVRWAANGILDLRGDEIGRAMLAESGITKRDI